MTSGAHPIWKVTTVQGARTKILGDPLWLDDFFSPASNSTRQIPGLMTRIEEMFMNSPNDLVGSDR